MSEVHVFKNRKLEAVSSAAAINMSLWTNGPIMTYTTALENAYNSYLKVREAQQKKDDMQMEIVFLVGFVAAGALIGWGLPVLATSITAGAAGSTLQKISKKLPGLNGGATLGNTSFTKYLSSQVKGEMKGFIKGHTKAEFIASGADAGGGAPARSLADVKWGLTQNALKAFRFLIETSKSIDKSDDSDEQKDAAADELARSPFLQRVPSIANRKDELQLLMEYTLFLNYIMEMDTLVTSVTTIPRHPHAPATTIYSERAIERSPSDPNYPKNTGVFNAGHTEYRSEHVEYGDPGNDVAAQLNALYRAVNEKFPGSGYSKGADFMDDSLWFTTGVGAAQMSRAESELTRLAKEYSSKALFADMQK